MVQTPFQQESLPPALESGDRLNRSEFERRYNAMPSLQKAELIEGVVYLPAALRFSRKYGESVVSFARGLASEENSRFVEKLAMILES